VRQFGLPQAFYMSFYSSDLYRDIGRNWRGIGWLYLFLLVALVCVPGIIKIHIGFSGWLERDAAKVVNQIPPITIRNGEVSTNVETPYVIPMPKDADTKADEPRNLAVIDLTGKHKSLEEADAAVFVTKKTLSVRKSRTEVRSYDLSQVEQFSLDSNRVKGWLETAKYLMAPVFYVFLVVFVFIYRAVQGLIYAAIGLIFVNSLKVRLEYQVLIRLAAIAVTPVVVVNELADGFGVRVPYWPLICFVTAMGYLFFAVRANATGESRPGVPGLGGPDFASPQPGA